MRFLLLGGPRFLGRAIADGALARGHELTFFNRGRTNPELYPEVEHRVGDRTGDLTALEGGDWDAVVDTSGYLPRDVRASAEALADAAAHYCFVSSVSVYADFGQPVDEESTIAQLGDLADDEVTAESYGPLKGLCEDAVRGAFGERSLVVRPGLIVGPHDPTGRFTYWPHRVARGGEVLAPGPPSRVTQFVDVRDLGDWIVTLCERRAHGTFNATHPGLGWEQLLEACVDVTGSDARTTWVTDGFLVEQEVGQWMELPLWISALDPEAAYFDRVDVSRALDQGLTFRPLAETIRGTLDRAAPSEDAGLDPKREAVLLAHWHEQHA